MDQTEVLSGTSPQEFLSRLTASGFLSADEIDSVLATVGRAQRDGRALALALVSKGLLTAYQMEAVYNGTFGDLRIGNYDILDRLGAGGMGTVYKARHRRMKRIVALKVMSGDLAQDETFVQRFQREVETIARLSHPYVVMAFDADEDDGRHFLVMEFVDGPDLESIVDKQGPLGVTEAVHCIRQAARGLEYAHGQGIIHRDIKPANLLRDATDTVKITDLGLARLNDTAGPGGATTTSGLSVAGGILGTVDYMPPEQAFDSSHIDHRADVYSLGATLHFLLVGRPPFEGTTMATLIKHREAPVPSLCAARPEVPPELDAVFIRMMAKAPADRLQSMTDVARELEAILQRLGTPVTTPDAGPASEQAVALNVILVEPSRAQSAIIRKYLQGQAAHRVRAVASGQEALDAARADPPSAIVTALHLPDMTGVQLAERVRSSCTGPVPGFVLISSESELTTVGTLADFERAVLLLKPFTPEQLTGALGRVARNARSGVAAAHLARLHVLIVDDSAAARAHVKQVLHGLGLVRFVEAADGAQAVAAVSRDTFDLIVTDYNMPYMDGLGLVGYLKQDPATASVPIIMVTTETDPAKLDAVRGLGVAAICDKSFEPEVVRRVIDEVVRIS
jgi:CheY-like chemotaxis protein/tRNA A-37 threonylcarbamoyl transferase component Bud32